jgi:hypothetical protein
MLHADSHRKERTANSPAARDHLAIALAALAQVGQLGEGLRWILATGRLGLDGTVHAPGLSERTSLADVVGSLCHTPVVGFEHMFETEGS